MGPTLYTIHCNTVHCAWYCCVRSEGDTLSKGESVVVVESDKADMDVETFSDGILAAILVGRGEVSTQGKGRGERGGGTEEGRVE